MSDVEGIPAIRYQTIHFWHCKVVASTYPPPADGVMLIDLYRRCGPGDEDWRFIARLAGSPDRCSEREILEDALSFAIGAVDSYMHWVDRATKKKEEASD